MTSLTASAFAAGFADTVTLRALQLAANVDHHASANRTARLLGRRRFRIGFVGGMVGHGLDFLSNRSVGQVADLKTPHSTP